MLLASASFMAAFFSLVASGQRGGESFFSNLVLSLPFLAAGAAALVAGLLAAFAVTR
jgi:hypothetical protein